MGLFSYKDSSALLEDLLEREREAVLGARFDVLERLTAEKERLTQTIARDGAPAPVLAPPTNAN